MGKILFKDFKVFDGRGFIAARDVLVDGERILAVGNGLEERGAEIIEGYGKILSPGFVDLHAHFRDPGGEWNEDIASGAKAGAAGGFTTLVAMPNTKPAISEPSLVEYVLSHGKAAGASRILPSGCVSKNREGKEMAELLKMADAGAVFFTDDNFIGNKIKLKLNAEKERKTLIAEGVLSIQEGINPRVLEEKLRAFTGEEAGPAEAEKKAA